MKFMDRKINDSGNLIGAFVAESAEDSLALGDFLDSLTPPELRAFKHRINLDLRVRKFSQGD